MLQNFEAEAKKTVEHLKSELSKLQIGRASASLVEDINVEVYGSAQPLKGVCTINIQDTQTILLQPWDKSVLPMIEKAISEANIGLNPQNDGINIFLKVPQPTEERRKEFVKRIHALGEDAKISIRNSRLDSKKKLERMEKENEITEDELNRYEKQLQEKVDSANKDVDTVVKEKEELILSV